MMLVIDYPFETLSSKHRAIFVTGVTNVMGEQAVDQIKSFTFFVVVLFLLYGMIFGGSMR